MPTNTEEVTDTAEQEATTGEQEDPAGGENPAAQAAEEAPENREASEGGEDASPVPGEEPEEELSGEGVTGVHRAEFQTLHARPGGAAGDNMLILMDVTVPVTVELGGTTLPLRRVLELGPGSVVRLDRPLGEPVDIRVNGELVGRGEVVVVEDRFGIQVTELVDPETRKTR